MKERNKSVLLMDMDPSLGLTLNLKKIREYIKEMDDKGLTTADLLDITIEGPSTAFKFSDFIFRTSFKSVTLDFIPSSIRLEDVLGKIWHTTMAGHGEKKLKQAIDLIPRTMNYEYLMVDNIPCYSLNYSLITLFASDVLIVPMRLTVNDLGRTIQMIKKLQKTAQKYEMEEEEFYDKINFVFNQVSTQYHHEKKIPDYKKELISACPGATIFERFVPDQMGFKRIGTKEEKSSDSKNVKDTIEKFYEEFEDKFVN